MTNIKRILCVIIALMLVFCAFSFSAFATGEYPVPGEGEQEQYVPEEQPQEQPQDPAVDPQQQQQEQNWEVYTPEENYNVGDVSNVENNNANNNQSGEVVSNSGSNLFDVSDINSKDLKENQWSDITLTTKSKPGEVAADFSQILDNEETEDNSEWILYLGIVLIGLSLLGILYFIIATVTYRNKLKKLRQREIRNSQRRAPAHTTERSRANMRSGIDEYSQRVSSGSQRRYSTTPRTTSSDRRRMKADTAEIFTPQRYAKK